MIYRGTWADVACDTVLLLAYVAVAVLAFSSVIRL
jgi:hypothetical protein